MRFVAFASLLLLCTVWSCTEPKQNSADKDTRSELVETKSDPALTALFERYREYQMRTYPEWASYEGDHRYSDRLTDLSAAAVVAGFDSLRSFVRDLESIKYDKLSEADKLNYDLFKGSLNESIDSEDLSGYMMPLTQQGGLHIEFPQIIDYQPLSSVEEYQRFFRRLEAFPVAVDQTIENIRAGIENKLVQPRFVVEQIVAQVENVALQDAEDTPFMIPVFRDDFALPTEAGIQTTAELQTLVTLRVQPAYRKLHTFLKEEYLPAAREEPGIWSMPDGERRYQRAIKHHTTTDLSADEIFQIGMQEVERIHARMEALKVELGYDMPMDRFYDFLRNDEQFYFTDKDSLMQVYRVILKTMDSRLPQLFGRLPQAPYDLKEMEAYRARSAPQAYYYSAPEDRSRPGYFYVNTYDLPSRPKYTMTALALHEAVPGHHLQIAIAQELEDLPWFRRQLGFTAFVEGWGLYAEHLGYESGMYEDLLQRFGALTFEMWRACRLVVDAGLHHKKWERERAVQFMKKYTPNSELDIRSEIDRYIVWPGQALAYKIGELRIKELRGKAETALGEAFDLREFHDQVLGNGAIPLWLLEKKLQKWIDRQATTG